MRVEYPIRLIGAHPADVAQSPKYYWDNARRSREGVCTIQMTLAGRGVYEYEGCRQIIEPGRAFLFTVREDSCYYYPPEFSEPWRFCWVTFAGAFQWFEDLRRRFGRVVEVNPKGEAYDAVMDVARRFHGQQFHDALHGSELVYRMLVALEREWTSQQSADPIDRAMDLIRIHRDVPWSVQELADHYRLSREHFIRAFTARHGISPGALIRQLRLKYARRLIHISHISVSEVARQCGYADISSFTRAFTREFGQSPEQMRTEIRSGES